MKKSFQILRKKYGIIIQNKTAANGRPPLHASATNAVDNNLKK